MKLFIKNCFRALLCLYRSHPSNRHHPKTPFRGQGVKHTFRGQGAELPKSEQHPSNAHVPRTPFRGQGANTSDLQAIAYIGSHYPCLLSKLLMLSNLMTKIKNPLIYPFPFSKPSVFSSWYLVLSTWYLSLLKSQISPLISRISLLASLTLLLSPKVALTQTPTGTESHHSVPQREVNKSGLLIYGQIYSHQQFPDVDLEILPSPIDLVSKNPSPIQLKTATRIGNVWDGANGEHIFLFDVYGLTQNGFLSLRVGENTLISNFLYNPGDSLKVRFDLMTGTTVFSGPSASSYEVQYLMKREVAKLELTRPIVFATHDKESFLSRGNVAQIVNESRTAWRKEITVLEQTTHQKNTELLLGLVNLINPEDPRWKVLYAFKNKLHPEDYLKLKVWLTGTIAKEKIFAAYIQIINLKASNDTAVLNTFLSDASRVLKDQLKEIPPIKHVQGNDPYLEYLYYAARILAESEAKDWYTGILEYIPFPYRDLLLAKHLVRQKDLDKSLITNWIPILQNEEVRTFINNYLNSSNLGKIIPDAGFQNTDLEPVNLHDFLGKWTLIDFWYTGCAACIKYFENTLSPLEKALSQNPNFQVISVSVDKTTEKWLKSLGKGTYSSPHAINLFTAGEGHHHSWLIENNIYGYPSQILLSPNGTVVKNSGLNLQADELLELILSYINSINHINPNHN